jgi:protein arginine kinase
MRASVLVHLPALTWTRRIREILKSADQIGITIRGFFGEGTEALGNLYQVSNRASLGLSEDEIVEDIERAVAALIEREEAARRDLRARERLALEDRVWRAYGVLRHARAISTKEAMTLLSAVRLGVEMRLVPDVDHAALNETLIFIQPAHVQRAAGRDLSGAARDEARATYLRGRLGGEG